jgi:hypothetical protein
MTSYNLSGVNGLAYYNGFFFASTNTEIYRYPFNNQEKTSVYMRPSDFEIKTIKIYGGILFCVLNNTANVEQGKITRIPINLDGTFNNELDLISPLKSPQSFCFFDNIYYITLANEIISVYRNDRTTLVDTAVALTVNNISTNILNNPTGIDTDGTYIYFCNLNNDIVCRRKLSEVDYKIINVNQSNDLRIYGNNIYLASNNGIKIINLLLETVSTLVSGDIKQLLFVNNYYYYSLSDSFLRNIFSEGFNRSTTLATTIDGGIFTFTYKIKINIDLDWTEEVGFQSGKVIINGDNKIITIQSQNLIKPLFFGGGRNSSLILEIKDLTINVGTLTQPLNIIGILRAYGYVSIKNCRMMIYGNILDNGGGFCYNNISKGTYEIINVKVENCSVVVNGKVGDNAGLLVGYMNLGCIADVSDSFAILLDKNPFGVDIKNTLSSSSGLFVGSGVGQFSNSGITGLSITKCYCIFSGSMGAGSGIIGGKFLASGNKCVINNFYAITNITNAIISMQSGDPSNSSYFLSSYVGGNVPSEFSCTRVFFYNWGLNQNSITPTIEGLILGGWLLLALYGTQNERKFSIDGITLTSINPESAIINENGQTWRNTMVPYYLNFYVSQGDIFYNYKFYSYDLKYDILISNVQANNKILSTVQITFNQLNSVNYGTIGYEFNATSNPNTYIYYSSSNSSIATIIDNNKLNIVTGGSVDIISYVKSTLETSYNEVIQNLIINKINPELRFASNLSSITKTVGDPDFTIATESSSNGPITFSSENNSIATILNNQIRLVNKGNTQIFINQASTNSYNSQMINISLIVNPYLSIIKRETNVFYLNSFYSNVKKKQTQQRIKKTINKM